MLWRQIRLIKLCPAEAGRGPEGQHAPSEGLGFQAESNLASRAVARIAWGFWGCAEPTAARIAAAVAHGGGDIRMTSGLKRSNQIVILA